MPLRGVVFDFDGLLIDTETPEFEAWCQVFEERGVVLRLEEWAKCVGGGDPPWRVQNHLVELVPDVDLAAADQRACEIRDAQLLVLDMQPGAVELFDRLDRFEIPFGIASSSRSLWVDGFLRNLGLRERFDVILTWDMVGAKKPSPKSYLAACDGLGIAPDHALAFEDSTNGIQAAKCAGMKVVAIPNPVTAGFDLSQADYRLNSLLEVSDEFLLALM